LYDPPRYFNDPIAIEVLGKTRQTGLKPNFMGMAGRVVEAFATTGGQFREAVTWRAHGI
jgi:hypothetical protein